MAFTRAKLREEKEKKQQHVKVTEIILMTRFTLFKSSMIQKVFEISTRSSRTSFTVAPHGIPNVLEEFCHVSKLLRCERRRLHLNQRRSRTPMSSFDPSRSPDTRGPTI
ncbi:hypothetical protein AVEN_173762-1 [Araneus ventricosus]|uniref:Uncharacterized protein n=1 Tax=Araneus ventricosus TaxID=182803 RepID=A0A4Y2LWY9_ARAVE|nr:hypothetical protein AVEN_173762-1 [Araneus ventricosus]